MKLNSFSVIDKIDHRTSVWVEIADKRSLDFSFWLKRKKTRNNVLVVSAQTFTFYSISLKDLQITDYSVSYMMNKLSEVIVNYLLWRVKGWKAWTN